MNKTNEELRDELHVCHERIAELERERDGLAAGIKHIQAVWDHGDDIFSDDWIDRVADDEPLICNTCEKEIDYMPWHYSTETDRHIHACNECWPSVKAKWLAEVFEAAEKYAMCEQDAAMLRLNAVNLRRQAKGDTNA